MFNSCNGIPAVGETQLNRFHHYINECLNMYKLGKNGTENERRQGK